jgi:hypothetical protein
MTSTSNGNLQNVLENVKGVVPKHCDVCGTKYESDSFSLVKDDAKQKVVHIKCQNCGNSYLLNIVNPNHGMVGSSRAHLNLDISNAKELIKFASSKPVSINNALDAYNLFNSLEDKLASWLKDKRVNPTRKIGELVSDNNSQT